ncbi:hypothetical protein [Aneurinibacillus aneurinilyticus]|uniref:hypothetical protein n=1 Tax=Aneurinibacillus aneurinilyticus TaxID=1391 RepID=UPI0023F37A69|nr:hypothetical protein [Aneurinibacillus aneurinilyticus]
MNSNKDVATLVPLKSIEGHCFQAYSHYPESKKVEFCNINLKKGEYNILFSIPWAMPKFTIEPSGKVGYGARLENDKGNYEIVFLKVWFKDRKYEKIGDLCLGEYSRDSKDIPLSLFDDSVLYGLNQRYCLFFFPHNDLTYGIPFFDKAILIDALECRIYNITSEIDFRDQLLRLDHVRSFMLENDFYFYLKTGRIHESEKWDMWKKCDPNAPYFDHLESIFLYQVEDFVKQIKNNTKDLRGILIEQVDYNFAIKELDVINDRIVYILDDISNNKSEVKYYDIAQKTHLIDKSTKAIENYDLRKTNEEQIYKYVYNLQKKDGEAFYLKTNYNLYSFFLKKL